MKIPDRQQHDTLGGKYYLLFGSHVSSEMPTVSQGHRYWQERPYTIPPHTHPESMANFAPLAPGHRWLHHSRDSNVWSPSDGANAYSANTFLLCTENSLMHTKRYSCGEKIDSGEAGPAFIWFLRFHAEGKIRIPRLSVQGRDRTTCHHAISSITP